MATNNSTNTNLSRQTGTGQFVGDTNPLIAGLEGSFGDNFNANSNKIINLTDPTDNQDAATKAFVEGLAAKVVQYSFSSIPMSVSTTSTTYVSTGLTGSITPTNPANTIMVLVSGEGRAQYATPGSGTGSQLRIANFELKRTSGTTTTLRQSSVGRIITSGVSTFTGTSFGIVSFLSDEVAGSTSLHTYQVNFKAASGSEAIFASGSPTPQGAVMLIMELKA
jgi:hypothetical protein